MSKRPVPPEALLELDDSPDATLVRFAGAWTMRARLPEQFGIWARLDKSPGPVRFDLSGVTEQDSTLATAVFRAVNATEQAGRTVDWQGLPPDLAELVRLARAVPPPPRVAGESPHRSPVAEAVGRSFLRTYGAIEEVLSFIGLSVLSLLRFASGRARMRRRDFWQVLQTVSADALPIVSLLSFLIGLIIAFLGSVVLTRFGAEFAVAYLVGYGMLREMGAVITGIIMAGRSGAAFAAQLGSMKINEEIDALRTFGFDPVDFLVLPRLLALGIMMPLLTIYANLVGIIGGYLVATLMMDVPGVVFLDELNKVVEPADFWLGIVKALTFGLLVAAAGCLRGLQTGAGAQAVGASTTRAVVTSITLIIIANAVLDWAAAMLQI